MTVLKTSKKLKNGSLVKTANSISAETGDVLTLAEAAAYLRIVEAEVIRMVDLQNLPGRLIGQEWRFLKSALQDWLRTPPARPSKEAALARAGSWKDDPYVELELAEIFKRRGRD